MTTRQHHIQDDATGPAVGREAVLELSSVENLLRSNHVQFLKLVGLVSLTHVVHEVLQRNVRELTVINNLHLEWTLRRQATLTQLSRQVVVAGRAA